MATILSLETATTVCSVGLHEAGKLIALAEVHREHSHASKLALLIDEVIRGAGVEMQQLQAIAVSSGPGSYTGLRIGASTAKGLCYALSIPLISVGTLEILSAQINKVNVTSSWLCPMIDARRMEVYCRLSDSRDQEILPVEAKIIDETSFAGQLETHPIIFFGDGAEKCANVIKHQNASFLTGISPSARDMGAIAWRKLQDGRVEDLVHFEPSYLKEFRILRPAQLKDADPNKIGV